jgi:tRNA A37 threonylcarbamoyladenosine dehydratase
VLLATRAVAASVPIALSMGAGNKRDPSRFRVTDISKTAVCPLARAVRLALRKEGITKGVKAVWSDEPPLLSQKDTPPDAERAPRVPASSPFCPNAAGLLLAHTVVEDLTHGLS